MRRSTVFSDLRVQDDDELEPLLGSPVLERELLREWPLCHVERIRLADGRRYAYKAQLAPTVETAFYAAARSPILLPAVDLSTVEGTSFLAIEWCDAPSLADESDEAAFLRQARAAVSAIGGIDGEPPVHLDVSTAARLAAEADATADRLDGLSRRERLALRPETLTGLRRWARSPRMRETVSSDPAVAHGDLDPEEVLLGEDGIIILDWQRPIRGAADLDLVWLLDQRGIDPRSMLSGGVVELAWFTRLHWGALTATELLPDLDPRIPDRWIRQALRGMFRRTTR